MAARSQPCAEKGPQPSSPQPPSHLKVTWLSHNRKAKCAPNPAFPDGMDADLTMGGSFSYGGVGACATALPYPAPECGVWHVECAVCGHSVGVTAAGCPDDPRSLKMPCKPIGAA